MKNIYSLSISKNILKVTIVAVMIMSSLLTSTTAYGQVFSKDRPFMILQGLFTKQATEIANIPEDLRLYNERAAKIDAYYARHDLPLTGYGAEFVKAAEKHNIPWNLAAAIAMRESTGGLRVPLDCEIRINDKCKSSYNPFGWGWVEFDDWDHAIEVVSWNLGGGNPNTRRYYYNQPLVTLLQYYNPPSVVADYAYEVIDIMETIENMEIPKEEASYIIA